MSVGGWSQRRIGISQWVVTQQVRVDGDAVIAASDIKIRAVADRKRSAGRIRQRRPDRPGAATLFVDIARGAGRGVSARGNEAVVVYIPAVEPQPGHV